MLLLTALLICLAPHALGRAIQRASPNSLEGTTAGSHGVSLLRRMAPPLRGASPVRRGSREGAQPGAPSSDVPGGARGPIPGETRHQIHPFTGARVEGFSPTTGREYTTDSYAVNQLQESRPTAPSRGLPESRPRPPSPARSEFLDDPRSALQSPPPPDLSHRRLRFLPLVVPLSGTRVSLPPYSLDWRLPSSSSGTFTPGTPTVPSSLLRPGSIDTPPKPNVKRDIPVLRSRRLAAQTPLSRRRLHI